MRVRCSVCQAELDATNTHCPVCLRARPRADVIKGVEAAKAERRSPRRGLLTLGVAAAAAVIGVLGLRGCQPAPPPRAEKIDAPVPAAPPEAPTSTAAVSGPTVTILTEKPAPLPERERARSRPARRPAVWRVRGLVYDLMSLRPVAGARVVFQDKSTGQAVASRSGADGRYSASLPKIPEGGYEVSVLHRGFRDVYLEEMSPPYRSQSRKRRLQAAEDVAGSALLHVPLFPQPGVNDVSYDLVLFPIQ